jgi:hypothetical protein
MNRHCSDSLVDDKTLTVGPETTAADVPDWDSQASSDGERARAMRNCSAWTTRESFSAGLHGALDE